MSGIYKGLQALIKKDNPLAQFKSRAGHGVNKMDLHGAECCEEVISFCNLNQNLYNFFSESPARWEV